MAEPLQRELDVALEAARAAAAAVLEVYATDFSVEMKDAREPVTLADRRANALITARIAAVFPHDGLVAEESAPREPEAVEAATRADRLWLVDPLDGTKELIARNGEFAVMIGLVLEGRAALGVVATPATGEAFVGVVGRGAWVERADGSVEPLAVSRESDPARARLVLSRSHRSARLQQVVDRIPVHQRIPCGSVGVKAARLATARADVYVHLHEPGGAKLWDGCAPDALVRAAGGEVTDVAGRPIRYAGSSLELVGGFVATNGLLHAAVLEAVRAVVAA
jgi:3'(2'), 5'-bisphosphate nucleotidase